MKVQQLITQEGEHLVLTIVEHPSGRVLVRRVWEGAGKYVRPDSVKGYITLMVPKQAGLNIKP